MTASVRPLMNSGETPVPYCSARKPWISRTVMPRAYMATTLVVEAREAALVLRDEQRLEELSPSRGTSLRTGPSSVSTVLALAPLRWLAAASSGYASHTKDRTGSGQRQQHAL
jgi:hypothetical protein